MQQAKQTFDDAAFWGPLEGIPASRDARPQAAPDRGMPDRVVPLFGMPEPGALGGGQEGAAEHDWLATLELVRQVSARAKQTDENSRDVARNAQAYMKHASEKVEEARARAETAEAAARIAEKRAQEAEARATQAEERAQLAERRAQTFLAQAQKAEMRAKDAQAWGRRLHLALRQEFEGSDAGIDA